MAKFFPSIFLVIAVAGWFACARTSTPDAVLAGSFPVAALSDTLHLEFPEESAAANLGDTLPRTLFFQTLDTLLLPIEYLADSSSCTAIALQRFELNSQYDACLVQINQFWFKHQSILLFDKAKQKFIQRITVAEWYGGDGGQILTGSWLFDYNQDGNKDLVRRMIEHSSMLNEEGELDERITESVELLLWQKDGWVNTPVKDSTVLIQKYPIRSFWE